MNLGRPGHPTRASPSHRSPVPGPSHQLTPQQSDDSQPNPIQDSDISNEPSPPATPRRSTRSSTSRASEGSPTRSSGGHSTIAPMPKNRPTRTETIDQDTINNLRNMTTDERNRTINRFKRVDGG